MGLLSSILTRETNFFIFSVKRWALTSRDDHVTRDQHFRFTAPQFHRSTCDQDIMFCQNVHISIALVKIVVSRIHKKLSLESCSSFFFFPSCAFNCSWSWELCIFSRYPLHFSSSANYSSQCKPMSDSCVNPKSENWACRFIVWKINAIGQTHARTWSHAAILLLTLKWGKVKQMVFRVSCIMSWCHVNTVLVNPSWNVDLMSHIYVNLNV